jgi:transposase
MTQVVCHGPGMRNDVEVRLGRGDRKRLEAVLADRNSPQKHVWRARIILATAEGCGTTEVMRRAGVSKPCVWRWQRRFMEAGVDGLLRDKTRKPGKAPVPDPVVTRLIARTLGDPPGETTHWTSRAMAGVMGLAVSTVQKIWRAHGLAPHRLRTFKLSHDPQFAAKVRDVVGLYVDPPAHAVVLSVDEKSQIQALDRTQPGLPMKRGRAGTMTHDYIRNGTTTLFAALNILDGTVIGQCMQRHRHQEFLRFLNRLERDIPAGRSTWCLTTMAATSTPKSGPGWRGIRAGPSTSPRLRRPGLMRLKVSSPSSRGGACNVVCSVPLSTSKPRSTATSPITTPARNHSFGPPTPIPSLLQQAEGTKR